MAGSNATYSRTNASFWAAGSFSDLRKTFPVRADFTEPYRVGGLTSTPLKDTVVDVTATVDPIALTTSGQIFADMYIISDFDTISLTGSMDVQLPGGMTIRVYWDGRHSRRGFGRRM